MITIKRTRQVLALTVLSLSISGCSVFDWLVYKPDVPQGNYMEPQQVEKLRIDMTKEQAEYILGRPVLRDSFADDTWYYVYHFKSGRDASIIHKELVLSFDAQGKLSSVSGDYELNQDFAVPLEQSSLPMTNSVASEPLVPNSRGDAKPLVEEDKPLSQQKVIQDKQ
ncbi:outer membrane protein assembly factor BamE [Shewanella sp. NIFS-20-20]|uniref:outer membrane protein assembly factor BamE n=1 Tax=Shewanella sp. NIFS-20-20 TaxID=2853806 RepID=UPI001C45FFC0|nr:outer membrane protein assembly factor BamE [Shewanella sp. NIFS-20-20]MBV7317135.1 outer membrane protein assembly factor BamE [Shewanella sp. NIFS-20-20]